MNRAFTRIGGLRMMAVGLSAALLLGGCGQKGPLYLPEEKPAATQPATGTAPADTRSEKKNP